MRIVLVFLVILLLTGCQNAELNRISGKVIDVGNRVEEGTENLFTNQSAREDVRIEVAGKIAHPIRESNLKHINPENIHSHNDYKEMIDDINFVITYINKHLDSNFKPFSKERDAYQKFMTQVNKWSPVVDKYNQILDYSRSYDGSIEASDELLVATGGLCIEVTMITSTTLHNAIFKTVGPAYAELGLLKLNQICRPCVSQAMKNAYWGTKTIAVEKGSELWDNIMNLKQT